MPDIIAGVRQSVPIVLKAPPGAGKTTEVPPALLNSDAVGNGKVLLIQPRRLAARAAASRLAHLMGVKLGQDVGYHVRFDKRVCETTRLIAMTTGILLRRLQQDPLLEDVSCVLLDEFHERSLEVDLALGMLERVRTTFRPELKLVVMSATLDPEPILEFFGDAKAVSTEGRAFPVAIHHTPAVSREPTEQQVASVLPQVLSATDGDVLVFLPGVGEIRRTGRKIESMRLGADHVVHELYGDLPPKQQDAVLAPSRLRKIILATNVAETSITIPGVTGVIDSGLARVMRFDAQVGLPKLQLEPISQASAEQRAGRAGRTRPGSCYRLWPQAAHRGRREVDTPEIQRCDFSDALLTLLGWGERDVFDFPWLTPPPEAAVENADKLLRRLGAIGETGVLNDVGQAMLKMPLHPRLARFMVESARLGIGRDASIVASLLTERDPFRGESSRAASLAQSGCDVTDRLDRLNRFYAGDRSAVHHPVAAEQIKRVADQIHRTLPKESDGSQEPSEEGRLRRALLAAYPDRVARRRDQSGRDRGVMVGGRGVRLDGRSGARSGDLFLCIDVDAKGTEAKVRCASAIEEAWLDQRLIRDVDEPFFHPTMKSVVARRRRYFDDLLLSESPIECKLGEQVAELLFKEARPVFSSLLPSNDSNVQQFIDRVQFLSEHAPELNLPPLDEGTMEEVLLSLCRRCRSFTELKSSPWLDQLKGHYDYQQSQLIEKHAPSRMTVPSGNSVSVQYSRGKSPVISVRIQELFGWSETPRVAMGRVAVQLHLLGPNRRPQQITDDLANFWKDTYLHVRKELRGRYPKHHWPENPVTAKATHNGLKPRS
ncbi:MAG: ATP-dependent helicase HrpB [Rubripirellula sp.]